MSFLNKENLFNFFNGIVTHRIEKENSYLIKVDIEYDDNFIIIDIPKEDNNEKEYNIGDSFHFQLIVELEEDIEKNTKNVVFKIKHENSCIEPTVFNKEIVEEENIKKIKDLVSNYKLLLEFY